MRYRQSLSDDTRWQLDATWKEELAPRRGTDRVMADNLSRKQRSYCMSRVKNRDTDLETTLRSALHKRGFRFRKHARDLPGTPDVVFPRHRVAVFIDGDFWHGYRFPAWQKAVSGFWQRKIAINRRRDRRNFRKLRADGWIVLRVWQHQIRSDFERCVDRIAQALNSAEV
jgi:DNA mismatch endonuclease (patch repair protein)